MEEDSELEELKRKKMEQLQQARAQKAQQDAQIEAALRPLLTQEAWDQWQSAKFAKPDNAQIAAANIIRGVQMGQISGKVTREQMRELLSAVGQHTRRDFNIMRR
jgi:programmed cell death protein 5